MAVTIAVTTNAQWYEATLDIRGLTSGLSYQVVRHAAGLPDETVTVWTAGNTERLFTDVTPQAGAESWYTVHQYGVAAVLATSPRFTIPFDPMLKADSPLWDTTNGAWPVLRTVNGKWIKPLRLPVADYNADFGYRASVMQVIGSEYPVVATDVTVMKSGQLVFLTASNPERQAFIDYVRYHRVIHLASPCVDGLQHLFFRTIDVAETVPVKSRPLLRQWTVTYQQVPKPGWYGVSAWTGSRTWADVAAGAASWADATTVFGATWEDWRGAPVTVGPAVRAPMVEGSW